MCFVLIRWSGQGAPIWLTSPVRAADAKATASGLRSTSRIDAGGVCEQSPAEHGERREEAPADLLVPGSAIFGPRQAEAARRRHGRSRAAARLTNSIVAR